MQQVTQVRALLLGVNLGYRRFVCDRGGSRIVRIERMADDWNWPTRTGTGNW